MRHIEVEPINADEVADSALGGYPYRTLSSQVMEPKVPAVSTSLLVWPDGGTRPWGTPSQLEYHTLHEEIFVLTGTIHFDHWYRIDALGYMNHPPFWVHPTNFFAEGELTMLMHSESPPVVQFEEIPTSWDGREYAASGSPSRCTGVSRLQLDDLAWHPLLTDGARNAVEAKRIWDDADDGWTTWLMRVPPGWQSGGARRVLPGGDKFYVLEGDLTVDYHRTAVRLTKDGLCCSAEEFVDGGPTWGSDAGATFIRWTRLPTSFLGVADG